MLSVFNYNAGKGDCIRIRYEGTSGVFHNIMIDSGVICFGKEFASICEEIETTGERIDALVISHVDTDHLGGLLYNLRNRVQLPGWEVWMNHGECIDGNVLLSVRQNDELFTRLQKQETQVKSAIKGNIYELDGAVFRILWPNEEVLHELFAYKQENVLLGRKSDYGYSFSELMNMPIKEKDTSINNHASVIMEMEYRGAKLLFTGDAWAEDILRVAGGSYAMIKLPHHGSVRNLSERWGEQMKCNDYMICTDGVMHPDKQTVAKLMKWYGEIRVYSSTEWHTKMILDEDVDISKRVQFKKGEYVWRTREEAV